MPGIKDIPGDQAREGYFPGHATAGTAKEVALFRAPFRCVITAVEFIPASAITGADTNYFTLKVRNRTTGAGTAIPAALAFVSGVDGVASAPKTITLSATAADLAIAEGDVITAEKAVTASGLACPDGLIVVHIKAA
ncbi:MAG: hypothetical protein Q7V57_11250 [Actinomycetota bacterium]|nr:hypothetical protein [Actinomycetota bacterium]